MAVTVIAGVYLIAGVTGFFYHLPELWRRSLLGSDALLVQLVRLAAVVIGLYLLRGKNWARWAAVAWMAYHVVLGVFHSASQFAVHALFLAVIAWFLWRPGASRYFRATA